jgi:2-polyprenyl-3-methyl-5-hydroxy-6-metoxy-1,4-benzoquinol methylase
MPTQVQPQDRATVARQVRSRDFEAVYADAAGDASRIPWANMRAHPALVAWLNAVAPGLVRCGGRVIVVGCGLGDDVREIARRGYEVVGFDCSQTAIEWAASRDRGNEDRYHVADLFNLPSRWRHRFDLVVEINTIQSLPIDRRTDAVRAMRELLSPNGYLLVICRGAVQPVREEDGPPWALTEDDLRKAAGIAGLTPAMPLSSFMDDEEPPVLRIRGVFQRA